MTRIVGAYALTPPTDRRAFLDAALALPGVTGLEISWGSPTWEADRADTFAAVASSDDGGSPLAHVVTLVGAEAGLAGDGVGLAAPDEDARRRAVDLVHGLREQVTAWSAAGGHGHRVVAVEIHAFPSLEPELAGVGGVALRRSLAELASWDWAGAELVVEHCDARHPDGWSKGLLPLAVEIDAVRDVAAEGPRTPLGIALNTGRSLIEGRGPAALAEHVAAARDAGLLRGLIVSGAAARSGAYGPAWADVHPPLEDRCPESALSAALVARTRRAAGDLLFDGVKVAAASADLPTADRLDLVRTTLAALPA